VAPIAALYDPQLTLTTPPRVAAETGMNALAHCVEAVWSHQRTPEAEAIALAGCRTIVDALPRVVAAPDDLEARTAMLEGAALGGRCLQNAAMGVHHGLAQLVGGRTGMPHGLANALILPHAIRAMTDEAPDAVARIGAAIGAPDDPGGAVADLVGRLGLPGGLSDCGFDDDDLEAVLRQSQHERARAILEAAF
jgi:alcohol dehydrogenase class IV